VEPGDSIDNDLAGGTHPNGDETATDDGWAAFSGTSAAAPQVAGAAALIKQACPRLTPAEVKDILMRTARDVTAGRNHPNFNHLAGPGPDLATGHGLVDATRAMLVAKLRCIAVPIVPITPLLPFRPLLPVFPVQPVLPVRPVLPVLPFRPVLPLRPLQPLLPLLPVQPLVPIRPFLPIGPEPGPIQQGPAPGGVGLTAENIRQLEDMIIQSRGDEVL
jgi:Subtilase family